MHSLPETRNEKETRRKEKETRRNEKETRNNEKEREIGLFLKISHM
jgi:hypothetical protein